MKKNTFLVSSITSNLTSPRYISIPYAKPIRLFAYTRFGISFHSHILLYRSFALYQSLKMPRRTRFRRPFVYEDSTAHERHLDHSDSAPPPPPPPSTPQVDYFNPGKDNMDGPSAFGVPNKGVHIERFPVDSSQGPCPIPPLGHKVVPKFYIYRPDGTPVPLIALDELPPYMRVGWEDWHDPSWLRFMRPASMYPFPRTGMYEFYAVEAYKTTGMYYQAQNEYYEADMDRADCQSPQPPANGGIALSLDAMVLHDKEQAMVLSTESDKTVLHDDVQPGCQNWGFMPALPFKSRPNRQASASDSSSNYSNRADSRNPSSRPPSATSTRSGNSSSVPK